MSINKYVPRSIQNIKDRLEAYNESITRKLFSTELEKTFEVIIYTYIDPDTKTPTRPEDEDLDSNTSKYYYYKARSLAGHHDHLERPERAKDVDKYERLRNAHFQAIIKKKKDDELPQLGDVWLATEVGANLVTLTNKKRSGSISLKFETQNEAKDAHTNPDEPVKTNADYATSDAEDEFVGPPYTPQSEVVVIQGSVWPYDPIKSSKKITLTQEMKEEYIPTRDVALASEPLGLRLLATAMAIKEGFYSKNFGENYRGKMYEPSTGKTGTRSYRFNNPGNIGNTDDGKNVPFPTLEDGIKAQAKYIKRVANGEHRAYPLGKKKDIKPYYSKEIAENQKSYGGKSPSLPGYQFTYTGQLDQFVKIYATSARSSNTYMSTIISYFNENGIQITNESKIQDIIEMG